MQRKWVINKNGEINLQAPFGSLYVTELFK